MPGSVTPNLAQDILDGFRGLLDPLIELLADPAARRTILQDLGLNPDTGESFHIDPAVRQRLDAYVNAVDTPLEAFHAAAADIVLILDAVRGLIEAANSSGQSVPDEILHHLFTLGGTSYLRSRSPRLYWFARLLGFIEEIVTTEATGSEGAFTNLLLESFRQLPANLYHLYTSPLDTERDAAIWTYATLEPLGVLASLLVLEKFFPGRERVLLGWEAAPGARTPVADAIADRALSIRLADQATDQAGHTAAGSMTLTTLFVPRDHHGPGLLLSLTGSGRVEIALGTLRDDVEERVQALQQLRNAGEMTHDEFERSRHAITAPWMLTVTRSPGDTVDLFLPFDDSFPEGIRVGGALETQLEIALARQSGAPDLPYVLGSAQGTRLELGELSLRAYLQASEDNRPNLGFELLVGKGLLSVQGGEGDGFIRRILGQREVRLDFALGLGYTPGRGWYLQGGTGLEVTFPINRHIPGVDLDSLTLALAPATTGEPPGVAVTVGAGLRLRFGTAFTAFVDQLGFQMAVRQAPDGNGNLGPVDVDFGYKAPRMVGVAIDNSWVAGAGFLQFEPAKHRYAGALTLQFRKLAKFTFQAVGLLTTRLPDGREGYSLLISIAASDFPPIPLGLGFTLNGVGGLLGIHRSAQVEVLRAGLKNRTLDSVLFPADPLGQLPRLLPVLEQVFPATEGRHLVGLAAILGWGTPTRLTLKLALIVEFPAPARLVLLGQLQAILPTEDKPIVQLKMAALGVVDFETDTVALDASLYASRFMNFGLSGDMALRARLALNPVRAMIDPGFVLAVGGLHPRFNIPTGLMLPKLKRLTIDFTRRDNPRLRLEAYMALTSNTVQFGARAELSLSLSKLRIEGMAGFDVLIYLAPFGFAAHLAMAVAVKWGSHTLAGFDLEGTLMGPDPLVFSGKITFKLWFWSKSLAFDFTLGEADTPPALPRLDPLPELVQALRDRRNWSAQLPAGDTMLVTIRQLPVTPAMVLAHPLGSLTVTQHVVPLNFTLERFGNGVPAGDRQFTIDQVQRGDDSDPPYTTVQDWFAPGQFLELSDAPRLSRASFERLDAGLHFGGDEVAYGGDTLEQEHLTATATLEYEATIIDAAGQTVRLTTPHSPDAAELTVAVALGAVARHGVTYAGRARYGGPRGGVEVVE